MVALSAPTGRLLWKTYAVPRRYTGGAVWGSTPVVARDTGLPYVTTGNNYSVPAGAPTIWHDRRGTALLEARLRHPQACLASMRKRLTNRHNLTDGVIHGVESATAALLAYLPTQALGLHEGFWAAITAVAVIQNEVGKAQSSARDQFAGATIGGLISAVVVVFAGQHLATYAVAVILSMAVCSMVNVASAARLAGITATIMLLVPHQGSAQAMVMSRVAEVGWGVCVAVAVVWSAARAKTKLTHMSLPYRKPHPR